MRESGWVMAIAGAVSAIVVGSLALGLAYPDGQVDQVELSARASPSVEPEPTAEPPEVIPPDALAPAQVIGPWPGQPPGLRVSDGQPDWCTVPTVTVTAAARNLAGQQASTVGCDALDFMFTVRYSRLSLPRTSYQASDFTFSQPFFTSTAWTDSMAPGIDAFVADPDRPDDPIRRGFNLFLGRATSADDVHATALRQRVFYGPPFSRKGYRGRAVWINPTWSEVTVSAAGERLQVTLTASAALPVWNPRRQRDDMVVVPSEASLVYAETPDGWRIALAHIDGANPTITPLKVTGSS